MFTACTTAQQYFSSTPELKDEIKEYNLNGVDTLVEIGCQCGLMETLISDRHPNINFILEDLPEFTNFVKNKKVNTRDCLKKDLKKIKNKYKFVEGFEDSIPLPSNSFKKILCRKTVHEFTNVEKMVSELYRILKKDGELIIVEPEPFKDHTHDKYCKRKYLSSEEIISMFSSFKIVKNTQIDYDFSGIKHPMNVIVFTKF